MAKQILFPSWIDDSSAPIRVTANYITWKEHECWTAGCRNYIMIYHISEFGNATHGCCKWCAEARHFRNLHNGVKRRGEWMWIKEGRLQTYEF